MEFQTIITLKQVRYEAVIRSLRLYMVEDACHCDPNMDLPLFASSTGCPPDCEGCTWCTARKALRGVGQRVEE